MLFFTLFISIRPINITVICIRLVGGYRFVWSQVGDTKMCNTCGCRLKKKKKAKKKTAKKKATKKKTVKKKVKKKKK
jgi:hypothetical protein